MADGYLLAELAERLGGRVLGDPNRLVRGVATVEDATADQITFLANRRYRRQAEISAAAVVLVPPGTEVPGKDLLVVQDPYVALAVLIELFHPRRERKAGISPNAEVGDNAILGADVEIGPFAVIEDGAIIGDRVTVSAGCFVGCGSSVGDDTLLHPGVFVYPHTMIGRRCILHSGVVLGGDGFGFVSTGGRHRKIPQVGRVVIEDDVEIGANSTVDRGALGDTVVGAGTKIDNLVMVAHGVRIGPDCLLAGQAGIAGSTALGAGVTVAGQSGAAGHLKLGDGSVVAAKSAVFEDLPERSFVAGVPARDHRKWKRSQAIQYRLPEMRAELRSLKARVAELEEKLRKPAEEDQ